MNRRGSKEDDSGSDWDSMSEIAPPPAAKQKHSSSASPPKNVPATIQAKDRFVPHIDSPLDIQATKDNPPYDFKTEVKSPLHVSEQLPKPGKQRKGRTYDPTSGVQKHVTFAGDQPARHGQRIGGGGPPNPDSDSEDPLYSTVKPKNRVKGNNQQMVNSETEKNEMVNKLKKAGKNASKCSLEGIDNHGFVEDKVLSSESPTLFSDPPQGTQTSIPQISLKAPLPKLSENAHGLEMARQGHDSFLMGNNVSVAKECPPPLILTSGEALLESAGKRPVEAVNRALGESFAVITLPLTCVILFLHHLLRFVLQGLVRPVFVDSLRLIIEYLVQPFITGVLKPLLVTVHAASLHLSDTMLVCIRPLTNVLQSIRLVEVHYTSRYSVEEI
ncbi:uncharacterized protein LOC123504046 [Portunus trituberculatus]|uniref:uncharacterized protein LOC123504046 n=1 Tax=Portunus trituberculatus TaxID=210409 RepID=UPI001E1D0228|nr:uncharacterized protein LOC123504046 [Portunus trituberculatus]XP_045110232.1 uncharacterized protein LOC123504046 [Portunus trituberculatus]XP_045110233.1 uncharacterized protein LOC123504046 [Portunus trituberculatus]